MDPPVVYINQIPPTDHCCHGNKNVAIFQKIRRTLWEISLRFLYQTGGFGVYQFNKVMQTCAMPTVNEMITKNFAYCHNSLASVLRQGRQSRQALSRILVYLEIRLCIWQKYVQEYGGLIFDSPFRAFEFPQLQIAAHSIIHTFC